MGALLSKVTKAVEMLPPRIVIHSEAGAGKTTLMADVPGMIVLPAEEGLGILDVPHFERPESFADVLNAISELHREKHEYRALGIDTVDKIEPLVWAAVCAGGSNEKRTYTNIEDFGYAKGYIYADPYWIQLFQALDALRRDRKMTVVVLSHNERRTVEDPQIGPHDRIAPKLHKRANALMQEWADVVGFLELEKVATDKAGKAGRATRTARATGSRMLHLEDFGTFVAKNRYGLSPTIEIPKERPYAPLRAALIDAMKKSQAPAVAPAVEEKEVA